MVRAEHLQPMVQQVIDLCAQHQIVCHECRRPSQAWASKQGSEVCIPPIKSAVSYATALHEIGHILGRYQESSKSLVREVWAWKWAKSNALFWTSTMEQHAGSSMGFAARKENING